MDKYLSSQRTYLSCLLPWSPEPQACWPLGERDAASLGPPCGRVLRTDGLHQRAPSLWVVGVLADSWVPEPSSHLHRLAESPWHRSQTLLVTGTSAIRRSPIPFLSSSQRVFFFFVREGEEWKGLSGLSPGCDPVRSRKQQEWRGKQVQFECSVPAQPAQTQCHGWPHFRHVSFGPHRTYFKIL